MLDGVDGLSGTLSIITIMSIYIVDRMKDVNETYSFLILLFAVCILGYLWYNATPSKLMMGPLFLFLYCCRIFLPCSK